MTDGTANGAARPAWALVAGLLLGMLVPAAAGAATRPSSRPVVPVASTSAGLCQVEGGEEGRVQAAVVLGDILYFGGKFTRVHSAGGEPAERNHLAACRLSTGELLPWNPGADNWVLALATDGSRIYAGGAFGAVGGIQAKGLAAIDPTTGTA
ncbi:MAG: hypothetical protein ACRDKW_06970, partial [Actinomycetota bacterium]